LARGLGVAARNGGEQGQLQQFVIGHGLGAALQKAVAQPFAVTAGAGIDI